MKTTRILLSKATSEHLAVTGESVFIVIARVMRGTEEPETMGRYALHLVPCSIQQADSAVRVARGISKERKAKP